MLVYYLPKVVGDNTNNGENFNHLSFRTIERNLVHYAGSPPGS
ncbi:hypothetical protein [Mucilaginibacter sp.]